MANNRYRRIGNVSLTFALSRAFPPSSTTRASQRRARDRGQRGGNVAKGNKQALQEGAARLLFTLTACISILAVVLICVFLFANGIPGMAKIGVWDFLSGQKWKPGTEIFGILPFILGSIYVTAGALIVGVPAGLLTAIFMYRFASKRIVKEMPHNTQVQDSEFKSVKGRLTLPPQKGSEGKLTQA